ncbi:unknown [Roseburia sp. CAG:380]|nr:unknown [Roseburia sp. CAG:380]
MSLKKTMRILLHIMYIYRQNRGGRSCSFCIVHIAGEVTEGKTREHFPSICEPDNLNV